MGRNIPSSEKWLNTWESCLAIFSYHIVGYIHANTHTSPWKKLSEECGKGQNTFYTVTVSHCAQKIKFFGNCNFIRADPLWPTKIFKSKKKSEGSWHTNYMNPFVYGKSLPNKSSPKIIGTLTPLHPWLIVMLKFAGANRVKKKLPILRQRVPN